MIKQCVILVVYKGRDVTYLKPTPPTVGDLDLEKTHFHHCQRKKILYWQKVETLEIITVPMHNLF